MGRPGHNGSLVPEEGEEDAGQDADGEDGVNYNTLVETTWTQFVHEGDHQRSQVGQLDDDCQVGRQLPAFGESVDDDWKLHPETVNCHPRAEAKGAGQHVHEQSHTAAGQPEGTVKPLLSVIQVSPIPEGAEQDFLSSYIHISNRASLAPVTKTRLDSQGHCWAGQSPAIGCTS